MAKTRKKAVTDYGMVRVAAVVPQVNVADVEGNVSHIIESVDKAVKAGAHIVALPELCVTAVAQQRPPVQLCRGAQSG